jgi:hypothetical protein
MSKQHMVRAFCDYWGVDDQTLRKADQSFNSDMQELMSSIRQDGCIGDSERVELTKKLERLRQTFGQVHHMVYMTACSAASLSSSGQKMARDTKEVASA